MFGCRADTAKLSIIQSFNSAGNVVFDMLTTTGGKDLPSDMSEMSTDKLPLDY